MADSDAFLLIDGLNEFWNNPLITFDIERTTIGALKMSVGRSAYL